MTDFLEEIALYSTDTHFDTQPLPYYSVIHIMTLLTDYPMRTGHTDSLYLKDAPPPITKI